MTLLLSRPAALAAGLSLAICVFVSPAMAGPLSIYENTTPFDTAGSTALHLADASLGSSSGYGFRNDTVSFVGVAGGQGVVEGSSPGNYAAPVTDAAGDMFTGKYFSTGNTGYINIAFATAQQSLALLWGSVDMSNQITFLNGNQIVAVVDGGDIDPSANGFQGFGGSEYVMIDSALKFTDIEISSGVPSFELAQLRTGTDEIPVHEPASIALFGTGLLGLVGLRRRS